MSALIRFTEKPVRITTQSKAPLDQCIQVAGVTGMKLQLRLIGVEGGTSPVFILRVLTSMVREEGTFESLGYFNSLTAANAHDTQTFGAPLYWVRWDVDHLSGMSAAVFTLEGIAFG